MPGYFYHLFFELFPPTFPAVRSLPDLKHLSDSQLSQLRAWIPPPETNIFTSVLLPHTESHTPLVRELEELVIDRKEAKKSKARESPTFDSDVYTTHLPHLDWRFGRVSVESIDMALEDSLAVRRNSPGTEGSKNSGRRPSRASASFAGGAASKAHFIPLETKNTEFGYGVVHLYRDVFETPGLYPLPSKAETANKVPENLHGETDEALTTVAVLAVPSYMTASDFMGFVGEETRDAVSHFRMIRTGQANRYMVLMKFRRKEDAREFVGSFNGKVFNSMEPENCHVVFVKSIQFQPPTSEDSTSVISPEASTDPFSASHYPTSPISTTTSIAASSSATPVAANLSTKPAPPPTPSLLELPTCPVCLERMDETTGLLTILCQHVFHCACLSKWKDSSCPVCRYTQSDGFREREIESGDEDECCEVCGADSNLWICLICGNVGCGRYDDAHAFEHYKETSHCYAMDIETQRVWDYAGDGYVHRLIQNKSDGKLVELPSALSDSRNPDRHTDGDYVPREKLDNIGMEYTYLLTSQLDSQRLYFEEKVTQAADKASKATYAAEKAIAESRELMKEMQELRSKFTELNMEVLPTLEKGKERAERKAEKWADMARRMEKEWKEEKGVNSGLMERIEFLTKDSEQRKKENEDLKEQIRDLMFFVEAREKIKDEGEEVMEGTVTVGDAPPPPQPKRGKKGKGKR
ncbi:zf-UBP-domain-containing protein [Choiromyces venosus 120613-1]|uniref:Zf-UBP-domain-containing protein n=1 Tax=Choiromyces venosus 120613-1 TaxID=1336337 RepID=A0A3N4J5N6_9PEZI|nr:zf-UBP-domain-containing protein [Choiromyces venosus 120613-1]